MKIFIIGNIASGKTFLAKLLAKKIGYTVLSIDNFRIKFNNFGTLEGEKLAWDLFTKTVATTDQCIVETTGCSKYYEALLAQNPSKFIIKIKRRHGQCVHAFLHRETPEIPMPYDFDIVKSVVRNDHLLASKECDIIYDRDDDKKFWEFINVLFS
jgi:adenylate kinase family enzyme